MPKEYLTDAIIKRNSEALNIFPYASQNSLFEDFPYILIIRLLSKKFAKLTIYPINRDKILKVIFTGFSIQSKVMEELIKKLKSFGIIHTSGITSIGDKLYYECYLDLSLNDTIYKDLKNVLDKIKKIFDDINIVEICLS
jgi:hypothetical protein